MKRRVAECPICHGRFPVKREQDGEAFALMVEADVFPRHTHAGFNGEWCEASRWIVEDEDYVP